MEFQQFRILEEAVVCDGAGEHVAIEAAEDAATEEIVADKSRQPVEIRRERVGLLPLQVEDLRPARTVVTLGFGKQAVVILVTIMDDVGFEALRVLFGHVGVLLSIEEAQLVLAVEAH